MEDMSDKGNFGSWKGDWSGADTRKVPQCRFVESLAADLIGRSS